MWTCYACHKPSKRRRRECPECGAKDTLIELDAAEAVDAERGPVRASRVAVTEPERVSTGIAAWDHVLFGGAAVGSAILLAGPPGVGKTTRAIRAAAAIAQARRGDALLLSAEMPLALAVATAKRARANLDRLLIWCVRDIESAEAEVMRRKPQALVVDSIHAMSYGGRFGLESVAREVTRRAIIAAQAVGATSILISQVNKDGEARGDNSILHAGDVTMLLEPGKVMVPKNRFGPTPRTAEDPIDAPDPAPAPPPIPRGRPSLRLAR